MLKTRIVLKTFCRQKHGKNHWVRVHPMCDQNFRITFYFSHNWRRKSFQQVERWKTSMTFTEMFMELDGSR